MFTITDLETISEYGISGTCLLCDEPLEHGQIRARLEYPNQIGWAHEDCAAQAESTDTASAASRGRAA